MCGIIGVYDSDDAASIIKIGLVELAHRGGQGTGISYVDLEGIIRSSKWEDSPNKVVGSSRFEEVECFSMIGHARYATKGSKTSKGNIQPITGKDFSLAHNGQLNFSEEMIVKLKKKGLKTLGSDSRILFELIKRSRFENIEDKVEDAIKYINDKEDITGSYSLLVLAKDKLIALRDSHGNRPLSIGKIKDGAWVIASETCAFFRIGAEYNEDVKPGEMVILEKDNLIKKQIISPAKKLGYCAKELVYFSRPDSYIFGGIPVGETREMLGIQLAIEQPAKADIVIPSRESGSPHGQGYSKQSGIPFEPMGMIYNPFGRSFTRSKQSERSLFAQLKQTPNHEKIRGKRVVLIDDTIVRGTTMPEIVNYLRMAGAIEVHVRIASPMITNTCNLGMDTPNKDELMAAVLNADVQSIRKAIGADTLGYLSKEGFYDILPGPSCFYCTKCFGGKGLE